MSSLPLRPGQKADYAGRPARDPLAELTDTLAGARRMDDPTVKQQRPPPPADRTDIRGLPTRAVIELDRPAEIAALVRSLTFGEMIDLAAAMWKLRPDGADITQENLPAIMHMWAQNHGKEKEPQHRIRVDRDQPAGNADQAEYRGSETR